MSVASNVGYLTIMWIGEGGLVGGLVGGPKRNGFIILSMTVAAP